MENKEYVEIITRLTKIETKIDEYSRVRDRAEEANNRSIQNAKDIQEIKESNMWISRLVVSETLGLIVAILVAILKVVFKI